jgi:hypothetical protein
VIHEVNTFSVLRGEIADVTSLFSGFNNGRTGGEQGFWMLSFCMIRMIPCLFGREERGHHSLRSF